MKRNTDPTDFLTNDDQTPGTGKEGTKFGGEEGSSILNRHQRKIAGVLFSFSKSDLGEYWIVYHGRNTIGSSDQSNIILREESVSEKHALLSARVIEASNLIFELRDEGSNVGTILNNQDLYHHNNYASVKNGDRIQIGKYDLIFYVVDVMALKMVPSSSFKPMSEIPKYDK